MHSSQTWTCYRQYFLKPTNQHVQNENLYVCKGPKSVFVQLANGRKAGKIYIFIVYYIVAFIKATSPHNGF